MAFISTNTNSRDTLVANLRAIFSGAFRSAVQRRQYRATVSGLSKLSSRHLDDLGIAHSDIKSVARHAVYGL